MFKYTLEPYKNLSSRHICPQCEKKELTLYIDSETGNYIHPTVGRCNRESNCGYHYTPKQYFQDNKIQTYNYKVQTPLPVKTIPSLVKADYIPFTAFKASLKNYENNHFITFLISKFGNQTTEELIAKYYIGTSKHWHCSTVFYQIDLSGSIRTAKIILYNPVSGKRVKEPYDHVNWLHSILKLQDFNLSQCLFGEHLLKDKTKPIAIVESEKSAIISSVYFPDFIWLATGGKNKMKPELFKNLQNRKVIFFPDLKAFDLWSAKAKELGLKNYTISDLLETKASEEEKQLGLDIADYLLRYDHNQFRLNALANQQVNNQNPPPVNIPIQTPPTLSFKPELPIIKSIPSKRNFSDDWTTEINELENFFKSATIPAQIKTPVGIIEDVHKFINSHIEYSKANNGNKTYLPYLVRLIELKTTLS
jgi:hypothetical protein